MQKRIVVFAQGRSSPKQNSTAVEALIEASIGGRDLRSGEIVGLVSSYREGSIAALAEKREIPFYHVSDEDNCEAQYAWDFESTNLEEQYARILKLTNPDLCVFCGWNLSVFGLDSMRTIALFRGSGRNYHDAHDLDGELFYKGEIFETSITVNFILPGRFMPGPEIIAIPVQIDKTRITSYDRRGLADKLRRALRGAQIHYLPQVVEHVLEGKVLARSDFSVTVPKSYGLLIKSLKCPDSCT